MKKYKIEIVDSAVAEIENYVYYIARDSVQNALNWQQEVEAKIYSLDTLPTRCAIAEESRYFDFEVRQLVIGNYRALFRIENDVVQILHFRHGSMNRKLNE